MFNRRVFVDTTNNGLTDNLEKQINQSGKVFSRISIDTLENSSIDWQKYLRNLEERKMEQVKKYLSARKMYAYERKEFATKIYLFNIRLSAEIMKMISLFEVIFRNRIHHIYSSFHPNYLEQTSGVLSTEDYKIIKKNRKNNGGDECSNDILVSHLNLGFWVCMFINSSNSNIIWSKILNKVFRNDWRKGTKFRKIKRTLNSILSIRNQIAHHERILYKRDLQVLCKKIKSFILGMIENEDLEFYKDIEVWLDEVLQTIWNIDRYLYSYSFWR